MARILLKNTPVVVLDEATVFADAESESRIQEAFVRLMKGRTVIVIAHRLSTIIDADSILVLDKGVLAEKGKHEELLAANGLYKKMWDAHVEALDFRLKSKANTEKIGAEAGKEAGRAVLASGGQDKARHDDGQANEAKKEAPPC